MKIKILLTAVAALLYCLSAYAARPVAHKYENPTGKQFPIMACYSVPGEHATHERLQELADAGFNLTQRWIDLKYAKKLLDAAEGTGVKVIMNVPKADAPEFKDFIKSIKGNKNLGAWFLRDEPHPEQFKAMADLADSIVKYDNSHILYLNLLPYFPGDLNGLDYDKYVSTFANDVNIGMLSVDVYPVIRDKQTGAISLKHEFYKTLETVSAEARRQGQPFWAFSLATPHSTNPQNEYPNPTAEHMRLQMFSNLAYGAQGVQYFTYWCPGHVDFEYSGGPIDTTLRRTEVYDLVADLNREIQNLSWVFLGAKTVDVAHTGNLPWATKKLTSLPTPFKSVDSEGGDGLLVSHLTNGKNHFLMVVNRDISHRQKVTVLRNKKVNRVMPSGKMVDADLYNPDLWLNPGSYLLYQWTE